MDVLREDFKKFINSSNHKSDLPGILQKLHGIELKDLDSLIEQVHLDHEFERVELLERVLKIFLKPYLTNPVSGAVAREIARLQQNLGFIMKYKSYAVKATTILGYSVFIQNEGEGFSFQRHITHKTEVFHILNKKPDGFVFLCDYDSWKKYYSKKAFINWFSGNESNDFFDKHRIVPEPGDVFVIDKLGTVHTVIGCDLVEYATVSTDMVERLYDQNIDKVIPAKFSRVYAENSLKRFVIPTWNRLVDYTADIPTKQTLINSAITGGHKIILEDKFLDASIYSFDPMSESEQFYHSENSKILHVFSGSGTLLLADQNELPRIDKDPIPMLSGDLLLVPGRIYSKIINNGSVPLVIAEQAIMGKTALI